MSKLSHNRANEADHDIPPEVLRRVEQWVPPTFAWRVAWKTEGGQWFALAMDFDIVGRGDSPEAAEDEMFGLLGAYLATHLEQGKPFSEAVRRVPKNLRLRIHIATAVYGVIDGLAKKPDRRQERDYESSDLRPVAAAALC